MKVALTIDPVLRCSRREKHSLQWIELREIEIENEKTRHRQAGNGTLAALTRDDQWGAEGCSFDMIGR